LLLVVAAAVSAMFVLAGPATSANIQCGAVLTSSTTLIGNLDCSGTSSWALRFDHVHPGVVLNLNGFWVKGAPGYHVINTDGASGITIKNGTIYVLGDGTGIANFHGSTNWTVSVVNITAVSPAVGNAGIRSYDSGGLTVLNGSITGFQYGVRLYDEIGDTVKNVMIQTYGSLATPSQSWGVYSAGYNTGTAIIGNAFTTDPTKPQTGTAYYANYDAGTMFSGNTVTAMYWGIHTVGYNAGLTVTSNVFGGATPAGGNVYGIDIDSYDHGDIFAGNFIRNSFANAVNDRHSFNNTYNGNIATANGRATDDYTFEMKEDGYGPLTMVNNVARLGYSAGFYIRSAYTESVSGPPYSLFVGNSSIANGTDGAPGFYDSYSVGATWKGNVAKYNATDGFYFDAPWREIIDGNTSSLNGDDGFLFQNVTEDAQPLAVTNNSATYNGGFGFSGWDDEGDSTAYPVAGSGNSGGGTNGIADCYLVAGCS
jgi:hypothetical protein